MERKYKQRGYSDRDSQDKKRERTERPPSGDGPAHSAHGRNGNEGAMFELRCGADARFRSKW